MVSTSRLIWKVTATITSPVGTAYAPLFSKFIKDLVKCVKDELSSSRHGERDRRYTCIDSNVAEGSILGSSLQSLDCGILVVNKGDRGSM